MQYSLQSLGKHTFGGYYSIQHVVHMDLESVHRRFLGDLLGSLLRKP